MKSKRPDTKALRGGAGGEILMPGIRPVARPAFVTTGTPLIAKADPVRRGRTLRRAVRWLPDHSAIALNLRRDGRRPVCVQREPRTKQVNKIFLTVPNLDACGVFLIGTPPSEGGTRTAPAFRPIGF